MGMTFVEKLLAEYANEKEVVPAFKIIYDVITIFPPATSIINKHRISLPFRNLT